METSKPDISIILCIYNGEAYLKEALDSALSESRNLNVEILCIDDGSSDGTKSIIKSYGQSVHYLYQDHLGLARARNFSIEAAHGKYVVFLDADDLFTQERLVKQLRAFYEKPETDIVFGALQQFKVDRNGKRFYLGLPAPAKVPGTMMIKLESAKKVGKFPEGSQTTYFMEWFARAIEINLKMEMLPEVLLLRRIHEDNLGIQEKDNIAKDFPLAIKRLLDRRRGKADG